MTGDLIYGTRRGRERKRQSDGVGKFNLDSRRGVPSTLRSSPRERSFFLFPTGEKKKEYDALCDVRIYFYTTFARSFIFSRAQNGRENKERTAICIA